MALERLIWWFAKAWREYFETLDATFNFVKPDNIVNYNFHWKTQDDRNLVLSEEVASWYIWKMFIDRDTIYSPDFIIGSIWYLKSKTPKWQRIRVQIARDVSELVNGAQDVKGAMSFEEQKTYIEELAKKYHKLNPEDLLIENISNRHPALFDVLSLQGIEWLVSQQIPALSINADALEIARFLYFVMNESPYFFERVARTKPAKLKGAQDSANYYGMIELAIRISDFINWITIQGWEKRQSLYDDIIRSILETDNSREKSLNILKEHIKERIPAERTFASLHFDSKKYKELKENQEKAKSWERKFLWYVVKWATALSLLLGWAGAKTWFDNWNKDQQINRSLAQVLDWLDMSVRYDNFPALQIKWTDDKVHRIKEVVSRCVEVFELRFGEIPDASKEIFVTIILDDLSSSGEISKFVQASSSWIVDEHRYLDEFIQRHNTTLINLGIMVQSFWPFTQYKDLFAELYQAAVAWNVPLINKSDTIEIIGDAKTLDGQSYKVWVKKVPWIVSERGTFYKAEQIVFLNSHTEEQIIDPAKIKHFIEDYFGLSEQHRLFINYQHILLMLGISYWSHDETLRQWDLIKQDLLSDKRYDVLASQNDSTRVEYLIEYYQERTELAPDWRYSRLSPYKAAIDSTLKASRYQSDLTLVEEQYIGVFYADKAFYSLSLVRTAEGVEMLAWVKQTGLLSGQIQREYVSSYSDLIAYDVSIAKEFLERSGIIK